MSANTYLSINIHDYSFKLKDWDGCVDIYLGQGTSLEDAVIKANLYEESHPDDVEYGIYLDHEKPKHETKDRDDKIRAILHEFDHADVRVSLGNPSQRVIKVKGKTMKLSTWLKKKLLSIS